MKLTVVGCSGSYPGPESPASCYLLEADHDGRTWRLVLDLGNGSLGHLHRHIDPFEVDAVMISHHHPDHCADLCGFYVLRKYHPFRTAEPLPVWGPWGTSARVRDAYGLPDSQGMEEVYDFRTYGGSEPFEVGPFSVTSRLVDHPVEAYGLRVSADGATLGYSGDTAPCAGLDEIAHDVDLFLCEASFRNGDVNPPHVHLTGRDAGEAAKRGGSARLVLTHVPPWFERDQMMAEAREVYDGPIDLATPGGVYQL